MTPNLKVSGHYPPLYVLELQLAAQSNDIQRINVLTDLLVFDGLARKRSDMSQIDRLRDSCSRRKPA